MSSVALACALGLGGAGHGGFEKAVTLLPAQSCTPSPCLPPTIPTSVTPLPDVTTSIWTQPGEGGGAVGTGGSGFPSADDGPPVTGGDVAALIAMGVVIVGCAAVATVAIRRRRSRLYG